MNASKLSTCHSSLLYSTRNPLHSSKRSKISKCLIFSAIKRPDQNLNPLPPINDSSTTLKKFTQLWAIILPMGYGFIPLIASALQPPLGSQQASQATAALLGESLILLLITRIVPVNNYTFIPSQVSYGIVAGAFSLSVALFLPHILILNNTTTSTPLVQPPIESPIFILPLFAATCILAPIIEEMVYRGYLQQRLVNIHGSSPTSAILVSAAAFSVGHLQQSSFGVLQLFIIGIAFGVAYQMTQKEDGERELDRDDDDDSSIGSSAENKMASIVANNSKMETITISSSGKYSNSEVNNLSGSLAAHVLYNAILFLDAASNGIWPV